MRGLRQDHPQEEAGPGCQSNPEYLNDVLQGTIQRGELLRQALDEMGWRENGSLNILDGRRYQYKGFKKGVAWREASPRSNIS